MSQPRVPRGTPKTGGQFAEGRKPEGGELTLEEAFKEMRYWSRNYARRFGVDSDDVMQDAMLTYSSLVKAPDKPITVPQIVNAAKYAAIASIKGRSNHRDDAALAAYFDECAEQMNKLGRTLTYSEEDAIATDIRERTTRNPPSHGFHRRVMDHSFSTQQPDDASTSEANMLHDVEKSLLANSVVADASEFKEGSPGALAMERAANDNIAQARRIAWEALTDDSTPRPLSRTIGRKYAAVLRDEVAQAGGAVTCVKLYERGLLDSEAIFAPFGPLDDDGKDAVCRVLTKYPRYGDSLWMTALTIAEGRR